MIKYIASDLDGTLLQNGAQKPDNETLELIRRLTEAGIHFITASGRQYINMYRMFGACAGYDFLCFGKWCSRHGSAQSRHQRLS